MIWITRSMCIEFTLVSFEKDFTKIVPPELAANIVSRLRQGEIVEFPNRYELSQVKGRFRGCFVV